MAARQRKIRELVRTELTPYLEQPRGKDQKSLRDRVLAHITKMVDQKDDKGRPTPDAQRWWRWIIERTDPKPGAEGAGDAGQTFNGPVQVVLTYEGPDPAPKEEDLPPLPPRRTGPDLQGGQAVQRGAVRKTIRKDDPG